VHCLFSLSLLLHCLQLRDGWNLFKVLTKLILQEVYMRMLYKTHFQSTWKFVHALCRFHTQIPLLWVARLLSQIKEQLRWLTTVFLRLNSAHYHCLQNISINLAFKNDACNSKKKRNRFSTWKVLNHFSLSSNSFKLRSNMFKPRAKNIWQKSSINNR